MLRRRPEANPNVPPAARAAGPLVGELLLKRFQRRDEIDADRIGLVILNEAGYDPREASRALQNAVVGTLGGVLWNHPDPAARLANVNAWIGAAWGADYSDRIVTTMDFDEFKRPRAR